ncbi:hypothetical protein [Sulfobacillus sp. hq2]|uniref:hypothetical protein n=1 Tax=Sulfobacillus TaxID=28033 RepID=UPI000CD256B2|nr:hypothetical protein [Sulfobacillus sp. hq2]POB10195.1 hypothetical protein CO251_11105 [Sulfobacillus sp. hq2]
MLAAPHAVQFGLLWLAHPEWTLPSDQYYWLLAILGAAYQKLGQLRTAELFYRLAQDHTGSYTESGLRMALNRGTCAWLLGEVDEAQRLFEFTRVESQQRGFALVEAWATIGWTTIQFYNQKLDGTLAALNRVEQIAMMLEESSLIHAVWHNQVVWARLTNQWDQQRDFLQRLEDAYATSDLPITLLTEYLYRWTHLHAYDRAQDCLMRARTRSAIGIESTEFWQAAATYFAACHNHVAWNVAQRFSQRPTISWEDSWHLFDAMTINQGGPYSE